MKIKRIITTCMVLALAFTCCACSPEPETPEQVLEKMQAALAETPCGQAQMVMDMTMSISSGMTTGRSSTPLITVQRNI